MKKLLKIVGGIVAALLAVVIVALLIVVIRTRLTQNDYFDVYTDEKYQTPIEIKNVEVIKQDISCGYAVIEMFSAWNGGSVTEEKLYEEYGKIITSTGQKFCDEMNKQFPEYTTEIV